jgi:N-acetylmuramic acid 6-phosphate etherase
MKRRQDLRSLDTEKPNPASAGLDRMSSLALVRVISGEDAKVAPAVRKALPQIARAIDLIVPRLEKGGRLIYVGTGTSGRIAALDAAECPPTFGISSRRVQFIMAGGRRALGKAVEASEDSRADGRQAVARRKPNKNDVVVGIAASGRTPFTIAALEYARARGAATVAISCNPSSPLQGAADIAIVAPVGPEVVAGSTRMKSGTAEKMILNMLSTGALTRLGYVYDNLMINLHPKNVKLQERAVAILERLARVKRKVAARTLERSGRSVPVALVMLQCGATEGAARRLLKAHKGNVRKAIQG